MTCLSDIVVLMPLFTRRTGEPLTRVSPFTRVLERVGAGIAALAIAGAIALPFLHNNADIPRWLFRPFYSYVVVAAAASYLVGVGIIRSKRWGVYLGGAALLWPFIPKLLTSNPNILPIRIVIFGAVVLGTTIFIRHKLGIIPDNEFDDDDDETLPTPIRNRGYGEGRVLAKASASETFGTPHDPQPVRIPARGAERKTEMKKI